MALNIGFVKLIYSSYGRYAIIQVRIRLHVYV